MHIYFYLFMIIHVYLYWNDIWWSLAVSVSVCLCLVQYSWGLWFELACFFVLTCPPSRFQFKHENCVSVCVLSSVFMRLVVWISMFFLVLPSPPPSFNLSMKTYLLNTKKEPCWKKHHQIEKAQEDNYIFAAKCWKQTSPNWKNTRG